MPNDHAARRFHEEWRRFMVASGYADHPWSWNTARLVRDDGYGKDWRCRVVTAPASCDGCDCDPKPRRCWHYMPAATCDRPEHEHHAEMCDFESLPAEAQERRRKAVEGAVMDALAEAAIDDYRAGRTVPLSRKSTEVAIGYPMPNGDIYAPPVKD